MNSTSRSAEPQASTKQPFFFNKSLSHWLVWTALVLGFLSFAGSLQFGFVYDDDVQIRDNMMIRDWKYIPDYFQHNVWYPVVPDATGMYYRPGYLLWLLLNYTIGGIRPWYWHLSTVLVHVLVVWLVFLLGRKLIRNDLAAAIAALIFAVHPSHVESVAWISGVTDPLMAALLLPGLYFYIRWRESGEKLHIALALLFYAASVSVKETAVVLPVLTFAYDLLYPSTDRWAPRVRQALLALAPFVAIAAVYLLLRQHALHASFTGRPSLGLFTTIFSIPWLAILYFKHLVFPFGLSEFYHVETVTTVTDPRFWLSLIGLAVIVGVISLLWRKLRQPAIWYAVLIFLVFLAPALYAIRYFERSELFHDRYLYLPVLLLAIFLGILIQRWLNRREWGSAILKAAALSALVLGLAVGTAVQEIHWASNLLMFYRGLQIAPENPAVRGGLASALADRHETGRALVLFRQALAMDPDSWRINFNYGIFLLNIGQNEDAIHYLSRAREIGGGIGNYDFFIGVAKLHQGKVQEAERYLRSADGISPRQPEVHRVLAESLAMQKRFPEAIAEMEKAIQLQPSPALTEELDRIKAMQSGAQAPR